MRDDKLIKGGRGSNQNGSRFACFSSCPAGSLPGAGDRPWITGQHCHIQAANVYAQFQRISRDDSQNFAFAQALFNFSPSGWQVTAAISPDEPFILQAFSILFFKVK